ncbi:MAG: FMN-binding protein [Chloroflexota bacterium]|nr:FMN-binding protein [Chloroflexota bacterium]
MSTKMPRRIVALSGSAIAAIYAAGFVVTRAADASLAAGSSTAAAPAINTLASTTPSAAPTPVVGASASTSAVATASKASGYADGTYSGQGTSRRGGLGVSVTIQGGAITNVQITSVNTEYPVSRIASLPAAVVKQQTASVNVISGATYSSQAFTQAVQQALGVAQASNGPLAG